MVDLLRQKAPKFAFLCVASENDKVLLSAGIGHDLKQDKKYHAGKLISATAPIVGGKGGGRADMAQAGGTDPQGLPAALAGVQAWVGERL